jgi:pilus assembly protein CpaC
MVEAQMPAGQAPGLVQTPGQSQGLVPVPPPAAAAPTSPATATPAPAAGQPQSGSPAAPLAEIPKPFHGSMNFEAGGGKILTLTLPAANIYVADPKVAEVRPASSTSLFVFGVGPGHTTIAAVDALGRLLADYQITVRPSGFAAREAQGTIARLIPGSRILVRPQGKGLILTGNVRTASDAAQAVTVAKAYAAASGGEVDNEMSITAPAQVTLMVRIAEMQRSIARNLGINWDATGFFGKVAGGPGNLLGMFYGSSACGGIAGNPTSVPMRGVCFDSTLQALAKDGLAHILAEPNLTVMSGQAASFQSGGEYPILVANTSGGTSTISVTYKPYGVLLSFVPTVLSDGRINLHVKPEVSQLDTTNTALTTTTGSTNTITPYLTVRRAETTVELGSGESLAIAGMLQTTDSDANSGIPGLGELPFLGAFFNANTMTREQTELVIVVTPILTHPVKNVAQLQLPAEGYKPLPDYDRLLLRRQVPNADGTAAAPPIGQAGFIVR